MPVLQKRIHFYAVALLGDIVLSILSKTWQVCVDDPKGVLKSIDSDAGGSIGTFWHQNLLAMLCIFRGYSVTIPVSEHEDGEYVSHVMERYGLCTVRGSTTRGGLRLMRKLVQQIKSGGSCAITPDGPRGPKYSVKPGCVLLARRCGVPLYPISVSVNKCWQFNSWDELILPKPFAKIKVKIGRAVYIPPDGKLEKYQNLLRSMMMVSGEY